MTDNFTLMRFSKLFFYIPDMRQLRHNISLAKSANRKLAVAKYSNEEVSPCYSNYQISAVSQYGTPYSSELKISVYDRNFTDIHVTFHCPIDSILIDTWIVLDWEPNGCE